MQPGDLITRCPHCTTTFRVTENQLAVAGGAVRCGSCLEIFAASNHLVEINAVGSASDDLPDIGYSSEESVAPEEIEAPDITSDGHTTAIDDPSLQDDIETGPVAYLDVDDSDVEDSEVADPDIVDDLLPEVSGEADDAEGHLAEDGDATKVGEVSFTSESDEIRTLDEMSSMVRERPDEDDAGNIDPVEQGQLFDLDDVIEPEGDDAGEEPRYETRYADDESDWPEGDQDQFVGQDDLTDVNDDDHPGPVSDPDGLLSEEDSPDAVHRNVQDEDNQPPSELGQSDEIDSDEIDSDEIDSDEIEADEIDTVEIEADEIDDVELEEDVATFSDHLDHYLQDATEEDDDPDRRGNNPSHPADTAEAAYLAASETASLAAEESASASEAPSGAPEEIDAALFAEQIKRALRDQLPEDPAEDVEERSLADQPGASGWWWSAVAVLVLTLIGQWVWSDREALAQDTTYRPVYLGFCGFVGCEVPAYNDPDLLTAGDLVVRQVPEKPGLLHIDAIIRNEAKFRQPFPDIYLRFSSVRGDALAARRFAPAEYLAGEMSGVRMIPPQTEVRISIAVIDPGDEALGYSLELIPDGVPLG